MGTCNTSMTMAVTTVSRIVLIRGSLARVCEGFSQGVSSEAHARAGETKDGGSKPRKREVYCGDDGKDER